MPTNYERYFGSPEATAETLVEACAKIKSCFSCPFLDASRDCPIGEDPDLATEWLESEANDAD